MTTEIHASIKITPKIKDVFYSFEYGETRTVSPDCDLATERQQLFDDCYDTVYEQIEQTVKNA